MNKKNRLNKEVSDILELKKLLEENEDFSQYPFWDSVALVSTIVAVDEIYGVILSTQELEKCKTIKDLLTIINNKNA
jgi:acyl carrier protein